MPLFDIIKSMSVAEKRHFKMYTGGAEKDKLPKYVALFDFLNKQTELDEVAIKNAGFKPTDKSFLQEKIEESLHVQHLGKNVDGELKWLLERMRRLYDKKLWHELQKCIRKAKELAKENERFLDWLQAIQWEKELIRSGESKKIYERYEQLVAEETEVRQNLNEEIDCQNIRMQIDMLRLKDVRLSTPENRRKYEEITNSPLVQNDIPPFSIKAKINYFHFKSVVTLYNKKPTKAYKHAQSLINIFENNTSFKNQHLSWYKLSLCLFSQICHLSGQAKQIPFAIDKIVEIDNTANDGFRKVCIYGLLYAINNLEEEKGEEYVLKIEALIEENKGDMRDGIELAFFYNIAVFYSIFDNWHKVNEWLSKILTYKRTDDRRDFQYAARILSLMNHYELESDDMDNHIQAVAKYLKFNQQYTETNQHIIQTFRDLYKAINSKEQQLIWQTLEDFLAQKVTTGQLGLGELQIWCKAKINNTTMAEIIRKK